jgi:hypothetical protein
MLQTVPLVTKKRSLGPLGLHSEWEEVVRMTDKVGSEISIGLGMLPMLGSHAKV